MGDATRYDFSTGHVEVPGERLRELREKERALTVVRRLVVGLLDAEARIAVADAIRRKDSDIRGMAGRVLPWSNLTVPEQERWLAVADAGLEELA